MNSRRAIYNSTILTTKFAVHRRLRGKRDIIVNRLKRLLWPTLLTLTATSIALAQGELTCPAIVQTALDSTRLMCSDIGRNQACYGNVMLEAQPQPGAENFTFDSVGDLVDTN